MNKGKMSENALKRSVLKRTAAYNKISGAGIGNDAGAACIGNENLLMSTAAVAGTDIRNGTLCVARAVNSLAAAGGYPKTVAVSLICPAENAEEWCRRTMDEIVAICGRYNIALASGNTLIGKEASVSAFVTGTVSHVLSAPDKCRSRIVIMRGTAGNTGAAMLAKKEYDTLAERLTDEFIQKATAGLDDIDIRKDAYEIAEATQNAAAMHDISEGGVFGALWELMEREKAGCTVNLKDIPIRQAVVEVCEILDVSPYQLRGDGGLLAIVKDTPENRELGTVIGYVTDNADRVIVNGEERRFLEPNRYDSYYEEEENER